MSVFVGKMYDTLKCLANTFEIISERHDVTSVTCLCHCISMDVLTAVRTDGMRGVIAVVSMC